MRYGLVQDLVSAELASYTILCSELAGKKLSKASLTGAHALTIKHSVFSIGEVAGAKNSVRRAPASSALTKFLFNQSGHYGIAPRLIEEKFSCCYPFITLYDGLRISEYGTYWLTDFPLINDWVHTKKNSLIIILSFEVVCTNYKKANKEKLVY